MAPLREVSLIGRLVVALAVITSLVVAREARDDVDAPTGWTAEDGSTELAVEDYLPIVVDESEVPSPTPTEPPATSTTTAQTIDDTGLDRDPTSTSTTAPGSTTVPDELAMAAPTSTVPAPSTTAGSNGSTTAPSPSTTAAPVDDLDGSLESDPNTGAASGTDAATSTTRPPTGQSGRDAAAGGQGRGSDPSTATTVAGTAAQPSQPATTQPAVGQPSTSRPETTRPETTRPSPSQPATTQPPSTQAPTTRPPTTRPPTTQPPTTQAPTTQPPTTQPPTTQAPTTQPPSQGSGGLDYGSNLAMIRGASVRNRNHDGSPHRNTPSASLNPSNHYGPRSDYLNNPAGNPEQSFPVASGGQFRTACEFSHFSYDDPLVYPGKPGAAHLHMYFGNTDVNAFSTANSLLNSGSSTCNGQELNRTGYWVPAMFDGRGNVRVPERIVVYYKGEGLARGASETYPEGAAMVINDNINTIPVDRGGSQGKFSFVCSDNYSSNGGSESNTIPNCDGSRFKNLYGVDDDPRVVLEMNVKFPQCWNGQNPGNPDNFRYPTAGSWYYSLCEGGFDHTLPNLEYFVNYHVEVGESTADWFLSSDVQYTQFGTSKAQGGSTVHGDWWGAWHRQTNQTWIDNCVNHRSSTASGCGFGYLSDGGPNSSSPAGGPALKYRPQYTGPNKVAAQTVFSELCPSPDRSFSRAEDAAYCRPSSR